jgi:HK97 gp10 family phage protein
MVNTKTIEDALKKACLLVEREAKQTAPKVNGELRRSITSKVEGFTGMVYSPLFYAPYVEYGTGIFSDHPMGGRKDVPWIYFDEKEQEYFATKGQKPQPYMRPALDNNREKIIEILGEGLKK